MCLVILHSQFTTKGMKWELNHLKKLGVKKVDILPLCENLIVHRQLKILIEDIWGPVSYNKTLKMRKERRVLSFVNNYLCMSYPTPILK